MTTSHYDEPLDLLCERAITAYHRETSGLLDWAESVRPADGAPGRWRWARETTRGPNVAATSYILNGLNKLGLRDRILTDADRREGAAWIRAMHRGNEQYHDPACLDRPSPDWPADAPWPDPAMQGVVNQYARGALRTFLGDDQELPPDQPPTGWPQPDDDPATMVEWVQTRPFAQNAWGAGSHAMRMMRYMVRWHADGRMPLQPVIDALNWVYSIQDPATGLWGTASQSRNVRINGNFKLYVLMREQLDLPIPHATVIVDQVIEEMTRPDYDATVGGCDEWDNWYVLVLTQECCPGYREAEIRQLAAWRLNRILEIFPKDDGGWSFFPDHCTTHWTRFDMAPKLPQGDAMGPAMFSSPINCCAERLGLQSALGTPCKWRLRDGKLERADIREQILAGLHLPAS